jgi:hypothetical protein
MNAHDDIRSDAPRYASEAPEQEKFGQDHGKGDEPCATGKVVKQWAGWKTLCPCEAERQKHEEKVEGNEDEDRHGGNRASLDWGKGKGGVPQV